MSVSKNPGTTTLLVIPRRPYSFANVDESPSNPALLAAYAACPVTPPRPNEDRNTRRPLRFLIIVGKNCRATKKDPVRLVSITSFQSSSLRFAARPLMFTPAFATTPWMVPKSSSTRSATSSTAAELRWSSG